MDQEAEKHQPQPAPPLRPDPDRQLAGAAAPGADAGVPPLGGPSAKGPPKGGTPTAGKVSSELPPEQLFLARLAVAKSLAAQEHNKEAILEYQLARKVQPRSPEIAWRLAILYEREGNTALADLEYQTALLAFPRNADLLNDLGYYHYRLGMLPEAEQTLRQALTFNPTHPSIWCNLGLVLGRQGRIRESYEAFVRVVRPAQAYSNLGVLLAQEGRLDEAREHLRQALALEPNLSQAQTVLARLEKGLPSSAIPRQLPPAGDELPAQGGPEAPKDFPIPPLQHPLPPGESPPSSGASGADAPGSPAGPELPGDAPTSRLHRAAPPGNSQQPVQELKLTSAPLRGKPLPPLTLPAATITRSSAQPSNGAAAPTPRKGNAATDRVNCGGACSPPHMPPPGDKTPPGKGVPLPPLKNLPAAVVTPQPLKQEIVPLLAPPPQVGTGSMQPSKADQPGVSGGVPGGDSPASPGSLNSPGRGEKVPGQLKGELLPPLKLPPTEQPKELPRTVASKQFPGSANSVPAPPSKAAAGPPAENNRQARQEAPSQFLAPPPTVGTNWEASRGERRPSGSVLAPPPIIPGSTPKPFPAADHADHCPEGTPPKSFLPSPPIRGNLNPPDPLPAAAAPVPSGTGLLPIATFSDDRPGTPF